jgi:hypothetical protein
MTFGMTPVICLWLTIRCGSGASSTWELIAEDPLVWVASVVLPFEYSVLALGRLEVLENVTFRTPMYL